MPAEGKRNAPCSRGGTLAQEEAWGVVISLEKVSFPLQLRDADPLCCCLKQGVAHLDKTGLISYFGGDNGFISILNSWPVVDSRISVLFVLLPDLLEKSLTVLSQDDVSSAFLGETLPFCSLVSYHVLHSPSAHLAQHLPPPQLSHPTSLHWKWLWMQS